MRGMPEIRSSDDDDINIRVGDRLFPFLREPDLGIRTKLFGPCEVSIVEIADDTYLDVGKLLSLPHQSGAARPDANHRHSQPIVGVLLGLHARRTCDRRTQTRSCR